VRINLPMTLGIMLLDMLELRRLSKGRHLPIQLPQPLVQMGVPATDIADVTFEMLDVDGVEADDGGVESDVGFGDGGAVVVGGRVVGEVGFSAIEGFEKGVDVLFVGCLRTGARYVSWVLGGGKRVWRVVRCKPGLVYTIVDVAVRPLIALIDLFPQLLGKEIDFLVFLGEEVVEFGVEHADDLARPGVSERLSVSDRAQTDEQGPCFYLLHCSQSSSA